tara:strand:- start:52 stop:534 length:483 start_codon:yes stop_codon:yes gene_type:complete
MSVLSLYVPVISDSVSEAYVKKMFKNKNIGTILRVDFVKNIEKNRREAFIHFDEWFDSEESKLLKQDILDPNTKTQFKFNDTGKFWPLLVNKNPHKRVDNPKYQVLDNSEVKNSYKKTLVIKVDQLDKIDKNTKTKVPKKMESSNVSYATVTSSNVVCVQ